MRPFYRHSHVKKLPPNSSGQSLANELACLAVKMLSYGYLWMVAPEQKARVTYDNILRLSDDPDVNDVIKFLREREIVHFQRFGEAVQLLREKLNQKNVYFMNPAIDL